MEARRIGGFRFAGLLDSSPIHRPARRFPRFTDLLDGSRFIDLLDNL
jgi:hypothetical protein